MEVDKGVTNRFEGGFSDSGITGMARMILVDG